MHNPLAAAFRSVPASGHGRQAPLAVLLILVVFAVPSRAQTATVYRSIDEQGVVSFSDSPPPPGRATQALQIHLPGNPDVAAAQQRLQEMRETTDRMIADRRAREAHRARLRRLAAPAQRQDPTHYQQALPQYIGIYRDRRWPRHHHGKPPRPPLQAPPSTLAPASGYNDYPASLIRRKYSPAVREAFRTPRR